MDTVINFTSAKYQAFEGVNESVQVVINGITMSVPLNPANRHYAEIMRQAEAGDLTIAEAD